MCGFDRVTLSIACVRLMDVLNVFTHCRTAPVTVVCCTCVVDRRNVNSDCSSWRMPDEQVQVCNCHLIVRCVYARTRVCACVCVCVTCGFVADFTVPFSFRYGSLGEGEGEGRDEEEGGREAGTEGEAERGGCNQGQPIYSCSADRHTHYCMCTLQLVVHEAHLLTSLHTRV